MTRTGLAVLCGAGIAFAAAAFPANALEGTFAALDGAWAGSGTVRLESGKSERLRCKGYYNAKSGNALGMAINCSNATFKIDPPMTEKRRSMPR